jgi:hypothetical protein
MRKGVGPVEDARAVVVGRLRARRDELVREIFARVSGDAFESAGTDDLEYMEGLRATVATTVDYSLQGIEHGEEWAGPIPVLALEQARRAARVGVSLDTVLRRYVLGSSLLEGLVMEEADHRDLPGVRGALRAQASVLDRLLRAITAEYGKGLARAGRSPEQRRYEQVRGLLDGGAGEDAGLDYDLGGWHLGVIATGAGAAPAVRSLAGGVDRRLLSVAQGEQSVWAWLGGRDRFAFVDVERVLAGTAAGAVGVGLAAVAGEGAMFALGEPARGLAGWRLTHRQAQAALLVALRRNAIPPAGIPRNAIPPTQVTFTRYADVALLATALKDVTLARALVEIYIEPLEDSRGGGRVLRETLRAYFTAERNATSAAAALGVVRNTVDNRLRTIEERLGRALHPCPAELEVALELAELDPAPVPTRPSETSSAGEIIA